MERREQAKAYSKERHRRIEWSLDFWRDGVIALISGAVTWGMTHGQNVLENVWIPLACATTAVAICELGRVIYRFVWAVPKEMHLDLIAQMSMIERQRDDVTTAFESRTADLVVSVPHMTAFIHASDPNMHVKLLLTIEIVNRGRDSIARHWKGRYKCGDIEKDLLVEAFTDTPFPVRHGTVEQVIKFEDAIYNKTRFPIARGSMANGVLVLRMSRNEWANIEDGSASLKIVVEDYLGTNYSSNDVKPIKADGLLPAPGMEIHTVK